MCGGGKRRSTIRKRSTFSSLIDIVFFEECRSRSGKWSVGMISCLMVAIVRRHYEDKIENLIIYAV